MFRHTYESIITLENLLATWERFLRGKRHRKDVMLFQLQLDRNIADLHQALRERRYRHSGYSSFNISDPKPRNIHKATVRDRLVHHLLYKALYPYFERRFIYDSYSCREEKGAHRAMDRFDLFARQVSRNHTRTCYVLKCDIRKFFANIDHAILERLLKFHIEDVEVRMLLHIVIASFKSIAPGKGLPLGNLTSQLLVNVYMHEFDRYVKQELRIRHYIRYADDFVILSEDRNFLVDLLPKLETFLQNRLGLMLHPDKVSIETYASGVDFLGWVHFPHHRQIRTTAKRKIIRNMRGYPKSETIASYRGLLAHGNTYRLRKRLHLSA